MANMTNSAPKTDADLMTSTAVGSAGEAIAGASRDLPAGAEETQSAPAQLAQPASSSSSPPASASISPAAADAAVVAEPPAPIEVDEISTNPSIGSAPSDFDDDDEGYSDSVSVQSSTTSISSSVRDYTFENSRRYHKFREGQYHFPNDEPEQEREDMRHCMMVHVCGGRLHYAPLDRPQKVLDVGTGTGIWAIDMGDEYPEAEIVGIDLSPIQPSWVPPNVRFVVDDAEQPWATGTETYDYIHIRSMAPAIKDWPTLMERAYGALKPGGWIEIQDINWIYHCDDDTMKEDYAVAQMATHIRQGLQAFGIQVNAAEKNPERLAAAGFENLRHILNKVPVGTWARDPALKTIGLYNRSAVYDGLQGITMGPLTRGLKWSAEEVELFLVRVRKDLLNARIHSYVYLHTLCGQKPM